MDTVPEGIERYPVFAPTEGPICHSSAAAAQAKLCYDRAGEILHYLDQAPLEERKTGAEARERQLRAWLTQLRRHLDDNGRTYIAPGLRADLDLLYHNGECDGKSDLTSTPLLSAYPPVLHVAKFIGSIPPKFSARTRVVPPTAKPKTKTPRHLLKKLKEDQKSGKVALPQEETTESLLAQKWRFVDQEAERSYTGSREAPPSAYALATGERAAPQHVMLLLRDGKFTVYPVDFYQFRPDPKMAPQAQHTLEEAEAKMKARKLKAEKRFTASEVMRKFEEKVARLEAATIAGGGEAEEKEAGDVVTAGRVKKEKKDDDDDSKAKSNANAKKKKKENGDVDYKAVFDDDDEGGPPPPPEDEDEEDESIPEWLQEASKDAARHDDVDDEDAKAAEDEEEEQGLSASDKRMKALVTGKGSEAKKKPPTAEEAESEDELDFSDEDDDEEKKDKSTKKSVTPAPTTAAAGGASNKRRSRDTPSPTAAATGNKKPRVAAAPPMLSSMPPSVTAPVAAAATASASASSSGGVTEEDIRQELRRHGRLETMQLAQNLKAKIGNNKQRFIDLLKKVAAIKTDPATGKKYLELKA